MILLASVLFLIAAVAAAEEPVGIDTVILPDEIEAP